MLTSYAPKEIEEGYKHLESLVADRIAKAEWPLFLTNAENLFETYLAYLNMDRRQHYNCNCCKAFFNKYGPLVTIDDQGVTHSLLFEMEDVPPFFEIAWERLNDRVVRALVVDNFLTNEQVWGSPLTKVHEKNPNPIREWSHFAGTNNAIFHHALLTPSQAMAEKKQDYGMLSHGLSDYSINCAQQALRILESDTVDRAEKAVGIARWFLELHEAVEAMKGPRRSNLIWKAVAKAPPGFCHIRSTMISTLLDDLKTGVGIEVVKKRWKDKMHPLQYQRPTAPVSQGTIAQANKIVEKLGAEGSLARRFAKIEDIQCFWKPKVITAEAKIVGGVFDHLLSKPKETEITLPSQTKSWNWFFDNVIPNAIDIELRCTHSGSYAAFVTAVDITAPPILQWDTDPRNPVSWYLYHGTSRATQWGLMENQFHKVNGLAMLPPHWYHPDKFGHQFQGVFWIVDKCFDTRHTKGGLFFPEELRTEFHSIRSAMEAYAKNGTIAGKEESTACGMMLQKGQTWNVDVRVRTKGGLALYKLDRWE